MMGVIDALAKLPVPPVPPQKRAGRTEKVQQIQGGSPGSPGKTRGPDLKREHSPPAGAENDGPEPETRRAWSDDLCRRLSEEIAAFTPAGLGQWPTAWHMVEPASARLLELLADWEGSGDVADQRAVEHAAAGVRHAWEHAARRWEQECADFERWCVEHEDDPDTPTPARWREL